MIRTITLSIDSFSVTLGNYSAPFENYDRVTAALGDVEYSLFGTPVEDGSLYEPKHVWTISAFIDTQRWRLLQAIYQRSERYRRTQAQYRITIDDFVRNFVEDSATRTRTLAPGGTLISDSGCLEYPARFGVRMLEPKAEETHSLKYRYLAKFVLKELDKITP